MQMGKGERFTNVAASSKGDGTGPANGDLKDLSTRGTRILRREIPGTSRGSVPQPTVMVGEMII